MSIKAEIIADSINPKGKRLTTFILEYPRFIHSELMTHRVFSKNAASSRAIPVEKIIQSVLDNPAMPVWWGKNQSGMQAKEELDNTIHKEVFVSDYVLETDSKYYPKGLMTRRQGEGYYFGLTDLQLAQIKWLQARDDAIEKVKGLMALGLHKQIANRILEPWFNIRIILSGTEFENFFALRAHPDAQPEFQALAYKMLELYNTSEPKKLQPGEWHIPFGDKIEFNRLVTSLVSQNGGWAPSPQQIEISKAKIAIARCARVSYLNFEGKDDYEADIKLCDRLFGSVPRHLSPTEHVAQCLDSEEQIGNFYGWRQYRYLFADQNLKEPRVVRK